MPVKRELCLCQAGSCQSSRHHTLRSLLGDGTAGSELLLL